MSNFEKKVIYKSLTLWTLSSTLPLWVLSGAFGSLGIV